MSNLRKQFDELFAEASGNSNKVEVLVEALLEMRRTDDNYSTGDDALDPEKTTPTLRWYMSDVSCFLDRIVNDEVGQ